MEARGRPVERWLGLLAIFTAGIGLGLLSWDYLSLPFKNPWGVVGNLTRIRYNPNNNILRFGVLVFLPVLLLLLAYVFWRKLRPALFGGTADASPVDLSTVTPRGRKAALALLLILVTLLAAWNFPNLISGAVPDPVPEFDTFHDGETLGPSVSYEAGQVPYKEFVFPHGVYEDPLRAAVAFNLFGRSIGALKTLQSADKTLAFLALALLLYLLFSGNFLYIFAVLLLVLYTQGAGLFDLPRLTTVSPRDITVFGFLIAVLFLYRFAGRDVVKRIPLSVACFFFAFVPVASFAYSIDRGFYIGAAFIVMTPVFFFLLFRRKGLLLPWLASTAAGLLASLAVVGAVVHWDFGAFLRFAVLNMPRYKELMDGFVYPVWTFRGASVLLLLAANTFWLARRALACWRESESRITAAAGAFFRSYTVEFTLWLLSMFLFRSALGRSDVPHIAYSSLLIYLLSAYILVRHFLQGFLADEAVAASRMRKVLAVSVAVVLAFTSFYFTARLFDENLLAENFPVGRKDSAYIPDSYKGTISFLKRNLDDKEGFVTLTNEGSWYYFLDRPSPVRFSSVWVAAPRFYQEEVVRDMKKKGVKYILYRNDSWFNHIDWIENEERLPVLFDYVKSAYRPYRSIDGNEIWIRKGSPREGEGR